MNILTDGLIIREQPIGEQDKLVSVITSDIGVIRAFVRGARNPRRQKCAATQLLCYSQLNIYKGRDSFVIDDASVKEMFVRLRTDAFTMACAQYFCELAQILAPAEQPASDYLKLLLNAIYLLAQKKRDPLLVKACVELRMLCLSGYTPDLTMCRGCGAYESEQMYFFPDRGILVCGGCLEKKPLAGGIRLSSGVLTALRHIVFVEPEKVFSFSLSQQSLAELNTVTERYLISRTEREFAALQFLKSLN